MTKKLIYIENAELYGSKKNIISEGIRLNPNVRRAYSRDVCDYIFMDKTDIAAVRHYTLRDIQKLVIIDYRDDSSIFDVPCLKYFKRSVVDTNDLSFKKYNRQVIPITFCLKNETLRFINVNDYQRDIDISVLFSLTSTEPVNKYRTLVTNFIKEKFSNYNIHIGICGTPGQIGRNSMQRDYYDKMFRSKIVVTCNPSAWEGDYRTWEALSSGAMVIVDKMLTPVVNPLIDGEHVVFYDRDNLAELEEKVSYYLKNPDLIKKIAKQGNEYALKFHKASDRIDEILTQL